MFDKLARLSSAEELARYTQAIEQQVSDLLAPIPHMEPNLREIRRVLSQAQQFFAFLKTDLS